LMPNRQNVWIIDPCKIFGQLLAKMIQKKYPRADITQIERLDQANSCLEAAPPNLVFIDSSIAFASCIATIKTIRRKLPKTQIVVVAVDDCEEYEQAILNAGADFFFSKNYSSYQRLVEFIEKNNPTANTT